MALYGNPVWPRNVHISPRYEAQGSGRPRAEATDDGQRFHKSQPCTQRQPPSTTNDATTTATNTNTKINNSSNNSSVQE